MLFSFQAASEVPFREFIWQWYFVVAVVPAASWTLWYYWKFILTPQIASHDAKTLPYRIPWLGSAIGFFNSSHTVIQSGLENNPNRDPFKVTIAGQGFYMVTNPDHVIEVYKNKTTLSFDVFVEDLMLSCGASKETVAKMAMSPPPYVSDIKLSGLNPRAKSIVSLAVDFHHTQLLPGPNSQVAPLTSAFLGHITEFLAWKNIRDDDKIKGLRTSSSIERTSLLRFCGRVLIEAGTRSYWGERLWQLAPNMLETFYDLDHTVWKLLFRFPPMFSKDANLARDTIIGILEKYYKLPLHEREDAAWWTKAMETESRAIGLTEQEMAATILIIYFVVNGNTYKMCFWVLCHILSSPSLHTAIKTELFAEDNTAEPTLQHLTTHCPLLDSTLSEVLRIYTSSASMRYIDADTPIGGKILRKGNRIMLPYRSMHENPEVFGDDTATFDASRFIKAPALRRSASYHPFGGGATLCAGRFLARQEVLRFIGTALHLYDIELLEKVGGGKQAFPRVDGFKPTFGMMATLGGDDFEVSITAKGV